MIVKPVIVLLMVAGLVLSACAPAVTEPGLPETGAISTQAELEAALQSAGATVEQAGTLDQPFFDLSANLINVNGGQVQVFEFPDEGTRRAATETIAPDASSIGTVIPTWVDQPNFWVSGRLIVLHVGQDQNVLGPINEVLGGPFIQGIPAADAVTPEAVMQAMRILSETLGIDINQVNIATLEQRDWPDACLGLPQPGEVCAQVITPGFLVVFEVNGQQFEFRTDQTGTQIRQANS